MIFKCIDESKHYFLFVAFLLSSVVKQPAILANVLSEWDISFLNFASIAMAKELFFLIHHAFICVLNASG